MSGIRAFDRQPVARTRYFALVMRPSEVATDQPGPLSSNTARSTLVLSAISGRNLKRSAT